MQAAHKLHIALTERGLDSEMIVLEKKTDNPKVTSVKQTVTGFSKVRTKLNRELSNFRIRRYRSKERNRQGYFSQGRGAYGAALVKALPDADVFNLHWSDSLIDYIPLFRKLGGSTPIVWRMADMNAMTGGCHYSNDCERFVRQCGYCPQLDKPSEFDLSYQILTRKERAFNFLKPEQFHPVAPSVWLKKEAERSHLLQRFDTKLIPTGVDVRKFTPIPKTLARKKLGVPLDQKVILFMSDDTRDPRKGFDLLQAALAQLSNPSQVTLLAVGAGDPKEGVIHLGKLEGPELLCQAYSSADLFVLPTRADNLPNVVLEAMACKVPVVSFDVGGMPDVVRPEITGFLAPPEDTERLAQLIDTVLGNNSLRESMSEECRKLMVEEFSSDRQAGEYISLYESLCARNF